MNLYIGRKSPDVEAVSRLLSMIISEPAFSTLRTKEQLGYVVSASVGIQCSAVWLNMLVQSHSVPVQDIETRMEAFLLNFKTNLLALTDTELQEKKKTLIVSPGRVCLSLDSVVL